MPVLLRILLLFPLLLPVSLFAAETHDSFLVRNVVQDIHDTNLVQEIGRASCRERV